MKTILFVLNIFLLTTFYSEAQIRMEKIYENDFSSSNFVTDMDCYDDMNCVAASVMSKMVFVNQTTDGGKTWNIVLNDSTHFFLNTPEYRISQIRYLSSDVILAPARRSHYYISTNGGTDWSSRKWEIMNPFNTKVLSPNFIIVPSAIEYCVSSDAGENWEVVRNTDDPYRSDYYLLWNVSIVNQDTLIFSGANSALEFKLTYTHDGGKTWLYSNPFDFRATDIHFFDSKNGIAVGSSSDKSAGIVDKQNSIFITTDCGDSWVNVLDTIDASRTTGFRKIRIDKNGFIHVVDTEANYWISHNYGLDWVKVELELTDIANQVFSGFATLNDSTTLIAGGNNSQIYKANLSQFTSVERTEDNDIGEVPDFVNIFPNPVGEELTLRSLKPLFSVEVVDMFGRSVLTMPDTFKYGLEPELNLDCSNLAIGMYILKLQTQSGFEYRKFVVNR